MEPGPRTEKGNEKKVEFTFEGGKLSGFEGESIAKALLRSGIRTLSYSLKYRRPRSVHCGRGRCGMCNVEVNGVPGVPACTTPLAEGMRIRREDFGPAYGRVLSAALARVELPAGFYYRTFNRPGFLKRFFMQRIRSMAGVGRVTGEKGELPRRGADLAGLASRYDVVVVGAGISGMAAAESAASQGCSVLLVDEYRCPGGNSAGFQPDGCLASALEDISGRIHSNDLITSRFETTAHGFYPPDTLLLGSGGAMKRVTASAFIFSVGCYDVVPLFANSELPGIFGERGLRLFLERDGLVPGKRAVIYGDSARSGALSSLLRSHGIEVEVVIDPAVEREETSGASKPGEERAPGSGRVLRGMRIVEARGGDWLEEIVAVTAADGGPQQSVSCDLLVCAFRGQPVYELPYQAGFRFELATEGLPEEMVMLPATLRLTEGGSSCFLAGEVTGETGWKAKIEQGKNAGENASTAR